MAKNNGRVGAPIFQDPFVDLEEADLLGDERAAEKPEASEESEPGAETGTAAMPEAESAVGTELKIGLEFEPASGATAEHDEPAGPPEATAEAEQPGSLFEVIAEADGPARRPEAILEPEEPEGVFEGAARFEAPATSLETADEADAPPSLLDDLIATIDMEVEQAFGPGAMADLMTAAPVGEAGGEQHVIFSLAETEYAAHIGNVTEIGDPLEATPVPNVPDWVLGVANLRGDIISMVDMRMFLGMEPTGSGHGRRMLVAQARGEELTTGLIVDRVSGIRYLDVKRIGAPAAPMDDQVAPYLRGVYEHDGRLLVVLDFDRLLLSPEMRQF